MRFFLIFFQPGHFRYTTILVEAISNVFVSVIPEANFRYTTVLVEAILQRNFCSRLRRSDFRYTTVLLFFPKRLQTKGSKRI